MNSEKIMEKQELIEGVANYIWDIFGLDRRLDKNTCMSIVEALADRYTIKKKQAYTATYTLSKTIYADDYEEASEILDKMSLADMDDGGEWALEKV